MKKLNERERRFVAAYLGKAAGNATKAAELAGYAKGSAHVTGARLLKKAKVSSALNEKQDRLEERADVNAERVIRELALIAFGNLQGLFDETGKILPVNELHEDVARMLAGVEVSRERTRVKTNELEEITTEEALVKVKSWDKVRALELLGKILGMLRERVDHKHTFTLAEALEASRNLE